MAGRPNTKYLLNALRLMVRAPQRDRLDRSLQRLPQRDLDDPRGFTDLFFVDAEGRRLQRSGR